jgi:signal transduction histidine kinase
MRWSIRYQLLFPLLMLLLAIVGISTWTAVAGVRRAWRQIETQVRDVARTLGDAHFPLTQNVLDQAKGLSGAEYLLVNSDGRRISTLPETQIALPAPQADWQSLYLGPKVSVEGRAYLCSGVELHAATSDTHGALYILYPETLWRDALWEAIRPPMILGGLVGLVSVALTVGVAQRLGRRLQDLDRLTRRIAAGDFSPMPLPDRNDELRDLSQAVNDMADQLARLQEAVKKNERLRLLGQVSGGLAHQLRNGVTGAILAVQLHAQECTSGADHEALDVALRQLALLESNLKRFLDLGKEEKPLVEPCSLTAVIDDAVALLRPQCRHLHTELRWQSPEKPTMVAGDGGQLGHLFLNVLGNAVEAAGPGGQVEVRLQASEQCVVEVSDSGAGPPAAIVSRLFQPFATSKQGGVGLGLAVARQVAQAHGGTIGWRREEGHTVFRIELPNLQPA